MIVRNEAGRLGRCLESVAGFADELVVVDTGSSDDTVAVAEGHGARVERIPWPGDFAPARNQALEWVRGSWVLVLDADEQLLEGAKEPLRALMAEPDILLINLLRQEVGALQSPYSSVSRLFRRHPQIRWSRPYHAMVDDSVVELLAREPHWCVADCRRSAMRATARSCWPMGAKPGTCGGPWSRSCGTTPVRPMPAPNSAAWRSARDA
jgi:glycosyltransferase involved in cell wall biosynthesis